MPSKNTRKALKNPWVAKARRSGTTYYLGYHPTYEKALEAELDFAKYYPPTVAVERGKTLEEAKIRRPFVARRYRNGKNIPLGSHTTYEAARAAEAAFDAANPRKKPGPNPNPDRPVWKRTKSHTY